MGCSRKDPYSPPPPHGGNWQYLPPPLRTSYTNLRHFLDNPCPPLSGRRKFPVWVGYGSFLEQPNGCPRGRDHLKPRCPGRYFVG